MALQKPSSNHLYLVTELCYFIDCDWLSPPWVYQHDYLKAYSSFQYFFFFKRLSSVAKDRNPVPSSLKHEAGVTIVCVCVWTILARGKWSLGLDCKALLGPKAQSVIRTPCLPTLWWTLCSLCQEGYHLLQLLVHLLSHLSTKNFLLTVSEKSKNEILLVLMGPVPSLNDDWS